METVLTGQNSPNKACTDGVLTVLPSSLDLLNFVVRECRPETAEIRRLLPHPRAAASHSQDFDSKIPTIYKSLEAFRRLRERHWWRLCPLVLP